jgi:biotin transport system substrate-specific component
MNATAPSLAATLWPATGAGALARAIVLVILGSLLLAVSAQVQVPMWPVPITMQTFAVLVIGMSYGAGLAAATTIAYLLEGAVGLPVFAGGLSGASGASFGYVIGFVPAAFAVGWLAERGWDRSLLTVIPALILGNLLIYLPGLAWLHSFMPGWPETLAAGFWPFLVGDALKLALAAAVMVGAWTWQERRAG